MAIKSAVSCCRRESFEITFQVTPVQDISTWDIVFEVRAGSFSGTVIDGLNKSIGSGITLTNAGNGTGDIILTADDTDMTPGVYYATISRQDTGAEAVLSELVWTIRPPQVP